MADSRKSGGAAAHAGTAKPRSRKARAGDTPDRDDHGRFKPDHHVRNAAVGGAVAVGAIAAGIAAAFRFGLLDRFLPAAGEGHGAEDLLLDAADQRDPDPDRRAPVEFRPDMDAPLTAADREALRPATGQPPAFAAERGATVA